MAHAATLDALCQSLIHAVTGRTAKDPSFRGLRDKTRKGLRDQSHARTNQFAIRDSLVGLTEKFTVLNREDLADALQSRLDELPIKSQWLPEILSLLLELSDKPTERTHIDDIGVTHPSEEERQPTWEDVLAKDPLTEPGVWDDIERGNHSSDDGLDSSSERDDDCDPTVSTTATSLNDDAESVARLHLTHPETSSLATIIAARGRWDDTSGNDAMQVLPELTLIREMLAMFHGLPTDLFRLHESSGRVGLTRQVRVSNASKVTISHILQSSIKHGSAINFLRLWAKAPESASYMRTMQSSVQLLLIEFSRDLGAIEQSFITPKSDTVVSVIDVHTHIDSVACGLIYLSSIVQISSLSTGQQLALLNSLYDEACLAQIAGNPKSFAKISTVFLAGLKAYLRPIAAWMVTGSLRPDNTLVKSLDASCEPATFWRSRFALNRLQDGQANVPKPLQPFAEEVFALGKSQCFLRQLTEEPKGGIPLSSHVAAVPTFEQILHQLDGDSMLSFSELLNGTLRSWISDCGTDCTPELRTILENEGGLGQRLRSLPYVYFSQDGSAFQALAEAAVHRISAISPSDSWSDTFLLTELAQSTLGGLPFVDAGSIKVGISEDLGNPVIRSTVRKLGEFDLQYSFSWPLQNITCCKHSLAHSKAFAFLLQIHHARSLLSTGFCDLRSRSRSWATISFRQRLYWFVGILSSHIASTTSLLHTEMRQRMDGAADIDAMGLIWKRYEERLETNLLSSSNLTPVREAVTSILEMSELLARTLSSERVAALIEELQQNLTFLIAGVRAVSRVGGESALDILAERLECSVD